MRKKIKLERSSLIVFSCLLLAITGNRFTLAKPNEFPQKDLTKQVSILNAFAGCTIRVMNFRGLNINFQVVREPILLLRYLSHCKTTSLFPFKLGSACPALKRHNTSTCQTKWKIESKLPREHIGIKYVAKTLSESFQLKNLNCEANIYLHPPTEQQFAQMYTKDWSWESYLTDPNNIYNVKTRHDRRLMWFQVNTIPLFSLLVCTQSTDSICSNLQNVKKWIAGVFRGQSFFPRLSSSALIWEYPSLSLKTICPYCDPCDSLKTFNLIVKLIPTSWTQLQIILEESQRMNPDLHSVRVVLLAYIRQYKQFKENGGNNRRAVLEQIQKYPIESYLGEFNFLADMHLTSLLLPESVNITFSNDYGKYNDEWKDDIVKACSLTKSIDSHPMFRPMIQRIYRSSRSFLQDSQLVTSISQYRFVSCHKAQMPWTIQLLELISPFDTSTWLLTLIMCVFVSWIIKISNRGNSKTPSSSIFDLIFFTFWSIVDQPYSILASGSKSRKSAFLFCAFCIPLSWLYLSILYKGENVTRLTAEPPLIKFDTFEMLKQNQFSIYTRRINLKTSANAEYYNFKKLSKLHRKHGAVKSHEALPIVSELWDGIMDMLRPYKHSVRSLNFLKDEISLQIWKYIKNSAMLPDLGQGYFENVSTILKIHMSKCEKSAMILVRPEAIKLHTIQKQLGKPSYLGKENVLEEFRWYIFAEYFPTTFYSRSSYVFEAGIFEWWQKHFEFSLVLKTNIHFKRLASLTNRNDTLEVEGSKTAVVVLTLIPGTGLLISLIVFICAENICLNTQRKKFKIFFKNFLHIVKLLRYATKFTLELNAE